MPGGRPLSAPRKEKGHSNSVLFWSGLREQKPTTECCRLRCECAETRSVANKACLVKKHDYVSSARTRRTSKEVHAGWTPLIY